jgi:hypothetical protein
MRACFVALVLALVMAAPTRGVADPTGGTRTTAPGAPPKMFRELVAAVGKAGFHRNTSEKKWQAGAVCHGAVSKDAYVCERPPTIWVTSIVANDDSAVVQELWLFETGSADEAARVKASLARDFDYGPFAKHPYTLYVEGTSVVAVEGRFRWHTAGNKLNAAVQKFLARRAAATKTP